MKDQTCPRCGVTEAAGWYCTACLQPTTEADWHPTRQSVAARGRKPPSYPRKSAHRAA